MAHARVVPSTAPAWSEGRLQPCHVSLRTFAVATGEGYHVMPGGLSRVLSNGNLPGEWTAAGQADKDVWILSDRPVAPVSLLRWQGPAVELRRSGNDLPSRVADNLYWLGRHLERAEGMVRLLRVCVVRITSELEPQDLAELAPLVQSLSDNSMLLQVGRADAGQFQQRLEAEVNSFLFDESRSGDFYETLRAVYQIASVVRDRLSVDTWRMVNQLDIDLLFPRNQDHLRLGDLLLALNQTLNLLVGLSGLGTESMTRGPGWRFLDMGRRLERPCTRCGCCQDAGPNPGRAGAAAGGDPGDCRQLDDLPLSLPNLAATGPRAGPALDRRDQPALSGIPARPCRTMSASCPTRESIRCGIPRPGWCWRCRRCYGWSTLRPWPWPIARVCGGTCRTASTRR